jgi:hypothetical protein
LFQSSRNALVNDGTSAARSGPAHDLVEPPATTRAVRRYDYTAEGLTRYLLQIVEPIRIGQKAAIRIPDQHAFTKLILPFDMEGAAPELILAAYLNPKLPAHDSNNYKSSATLQHRANQSQTAGLAG